jgi:hypothetical protein
MTQTAMNTKPKRGDLVSYNGSKFYYQPNGNTCFLFDKLEDIGHTHRAAFTHKVVYVKLVERKRTGMSDVDLSLGPHSPDVEELRLSMKSMYLNTGNPSLSDRPRRVVCGDQDPPTDGRPARGNGPG